MLLVLLCQSCQVGVLGSEIVKLFASLVLVRDEFEWDNNELGKVMGSFSYGYMMSQIVGGFLADKFGGAIVMAHCGVIWSILTYLTPTLVRHRCVSAQVWLGSIFEPVI